MPKHTFQRDLPWRLLKAYTNLIIKSWLPTYRSSREAASVVARSHSKQRHRRGGAGKLPRNRARWSHENCPRATAVCRGWAAVQHGAAWCRLPSLPSRENFIPVLHCVTLVCPKEAEQKLYHKFPSISSMIYTQGGNLLKWEEERG